MTTATTATTATLVNDPDAHLESVPCVEDRHRECSGWMVTTIKTTEPCGCPCHRP